MSGSSQAAPDSGAREIVVPFIIFTAIWGSTWIVIRDQLGSVPAQWSITYRFLIAAAAMALLSRWKGYSLRLPREGLAAAAALGFLQFVGNFNAVYMAERHITSGLVATVFALLVIPNSLLAWAWLGQRPTWRFAWGSLAAVGGIGMLFANELKLHPSHTRDILLGIGLTLAGMLSASGANVFQARERVKGHPLLPLLAWAMGLGALMDGLIAVAVSGAPAIDPRPGYWLGVLYLAIFASAIAFSLYLPVVRKIGPGKAAYSSVIVPVIAMGFSTWIEHYRWTTLAVFGALFVIGGMLAALARGRVQRPR